MKKRSEEHSTGNRRRLFLFIAGAAVVAASAITVISRQKGTELPAQNPVARKTAVVPSRTYVSRRVGNQDIQIDMQSGDIKPLTAQEAEKLANGLAPMLDNSTDGLVQVQHTDGSVSMDLQGRFQNVTVARVNKDGTVEQSCVNSPAAAAKFFRIDRKLIENAPTARKRARQE